MKIFGKYGIFLLCILGSVTRMLYGYVHGPWVHAPDHLAWEMIIEQGNLSYSQLIHYPHEGGSVLFSLFSQLLEPFTGFSSLTISAFLTDFIVRFVQITIVKKVFNNRVAILFGLWTIFASPIVIPWGTLNFGLHSISSVFPFILLLMLFKNEQTKKDQLLIGSFLGLAFWFSYSNIVLIPAFFLYNLMFRNKFKKWGYALVSITLVLTLHIVTRYALDAGFHLNEFPIYSIRGEAFSIGEINFWDRLWNLPKVIVNSFTVLPYPDQFSGVIKSVFWLSCLLSTTSLFVAYKKNKLQKKNYILLPIILLFIISYALSPFFVENDTGNHVTFRHLTYIVPLIALAIIVGLSYLKNKLILIPFLLLGVLQFNRLVQIEKTPPNDGTTKASGWVLANKLGHDTELINSIIKDNYEKRNLLIQGVGWGTSTALIKDIQTLSKPEIKNKIDELIDLTTQYPKSYHKHFLIGVEFSFSDQVTPRLDKNILPMIKDEYDKRYTTKPQLH